MIVRNIGSRSNEMSAHHRAKSPLTISEMCSIRRVKLRLRLIGRLLSPLDLLPSQALAARKVALGLIEGRLLARHICLGLLKCILESPLVDAEQLLTFAHLLVVVNKDIANQTRYVGWDLDHVGAHTAVARLWREHVIAPELPAGEYSHQYHHER